MKVLFASDGSECSHAAHGKFDLVLMGSHGRSALKNVLLGSVTAGVLSESAVPVLVVH
jgi:nucleotide-binding universal stress UspA family protein